MLAALFGGEEGGQVTNYRKGARLEREAQKMLEGVGYRVTRASGSHGIWDLVACHPTHVRLIQVKAGKRPRVAPAELEGIELERVAPACSKEIWCRADGDTTWRIVVVE